MVKFFGEIAKVEVNNLDPRSSPKKKKHMDIKILLGLTRLYCFRVHLQIKWSKVTHVISCATSSSQL